MSAEREIAVIGAGMVSAVGLSAQVTAASVRGKISGYRASNIHDRRLRPMVLATVPDRALPPLSPSLSAEMGIPGREKRMLRLAGAALRESLAGGPRLADIPLHLALPSPFRDFPTPGGPDFLRHLALQADLPPHTDRSRFYPLGRAAGFPALEDAIARLRSGAEGYVVVGGVDSHLDERLLRALDFEGRVRARGVMDGRTPGEGAAFLLLTTTENAARIGRPVLGVVEAAAHAEEPGHMDSEEPYLGEGLHTAFHRLFAGRGEGRPLINTVYAGFTGESFHAKEWGVAFLRHRRRFAEPIAIEHPADCLGDTGAALGPMLAVLAVTGMGRGYRRSPCLLWCSSDGAPRGCAIVRSGNPGEAEAGERERSER